MTKDGRSAGAQPMEEADLDQELQTLVSNPIQRRSLVEAIEAIQNIYASDDSTSEEEIEQALNSHITSCKQALQKAVVGLKPEQIEELRTLVAEQFSELGSTAEERETLAELVAQFQSAIAAPSMTAQGMEANYHEKNREQLVKKKLDSELQTTIKDPATRENLVSAMFALGKVDDDVPAQDKIDACKTALAKAAAGLTTLKEVAALGRSVSSALKFLGVKSEIQQNINKVIINRQAQIIPTLGITFPGVSAADKQSLDGIKQDMRGRVKEADKRPSAPTPRTKDQDRDQGHGR